MIVIAVFIVFLFRIRSTLGRDIKMKTYHLPFDTPQAERKVGKIIACIFGIALFIAGIWVGYKGTYFLLKGTRTPATVIKTRYFNRGFIISYSYKNQAGSAQEGYDHIYQLDFIPKVGDQIVIYSLADGRTLYLTLIDDFLLPAVCILFGTIVLLALTRSKK